VIVDGMIDPNHPEFAVNSDGTGGSRVIQYNWYSLNPSVTGGGSGTYSYLIDPNDGNYEHGNHVAGTVAGNTQGWARNANIYNISPDYVTGGVNTGYIFDYIRVWHQNKPVNPLTGFKNPTITNNSWGWFMDTPRYDVKDIRFRGNFFQKPHPGQYWTKEELIAMGVVVDSFDHVHIGVSNTAVDVGVIDAIAAGIIVVGAAMNEDSKVDVPGGVDYNNTWFCSKGTLYTNRGGSPGSSPGAICVGAIDMYADEGKADFSNTGPRIDIWAPGVNIKSSVVGTAVYQDPRNTNYGFMLKSGTSMATPQVTGLLACILERLPKLDQATIKTMTTSTLAAIGQITYNGTTGGFSDKYDLQGAPNRYLKWVEPTFNISSNATSLPTSSIATYTINTANVPVGTNVYLTELSNSADFTDNVTQISATITGNMLTFTRTLKSIFSASRKSTLQIRTGGFSGPVQASVTIDLIRNREGSVFPSPNYTARPTTGQAWPRRRNIFKSI